MSHKHLILAIAAALACSGGDDGPSQPTDGNSDFTVSVGNNQFTPPSLSVPVNSVVTWQWNSGGVAHNVNFQDGAPASGDRTSGNFSRTFSAAGTYSYFCSLHPPGMTGTVTVASTTGGGGTGGGGSGGGGGDPYP